MKTELAFLIFRYHPYGGLQRDLIKIALACHQQGYSVRVYTLSWDGPIPQGISVTLVPTRARTNYEKAQAFVDYVKNQVPSHILRIGFNRMPGLHFYFAGDECFKKQLAHRFLGKWLAHFSRYKTYLKYEDAIFNAKSSTKILLLTQQQKSDAITYYQTPTKRMYFLPPGVVKTSLENDAAQRNAVRKTLHLDDQQTLLLMIGSDYTRKGVDRTIRALAALPLAMRTRTHLIVLGKGKMTYLMYLARYLGVDKNIHFLGPSDTVTPYLRAADFLIHPARQETAGMVLIEAIMAGLPILTTENCGYAYHVQAAKAGVVLPSPFTQHTFNTELTQLCCTTHQQRQQWRQSALSYATQHNLSGLASCVVDIIRSETHDTQQTSHY